MRTRSTIGRSTATAIIVDDNVMPVKPKPRASSYNNEAMILLRNSFTKVSIDAIHNIFESCGNSFLASYRILSSIQDSFDEQDDDGQERKRILEIVPSLKNVQRIILKSDRKIKTCRPRNPTLLAELDEISELNTKENRTVENASRQSESKSAPSESMFECLCCYDECQFETMCQCDDGHLVCGDCLRHYVEEEMYGKDNGNIKCIDLGSDGCTASYSSRQLDKVFSPNSRAKVDEKIFRFNVEQVEMDDSCKCPKCHYIFILQPGITYTQVSCPDCKHAFCHQCNGVPHKGKTCEKAKEEKENLDAYASTATAMTEAVIRKCPNPKCNKRFFKEEGCNKMKCPSCKTLSCYICREALDNKAPYLHFCRTPHCQHKSCAKCVLFSDAKEDDRRARREVAQAALLAAQKKDGATNKVALIGGLLSPPHPKSERTRTRGPLQRALFANDQPAAANEGMQQPNAVAQQQQQPVQALHSPLRGAIVRPPAVEQPLRNDPTQWPNGILHHQQRGHRHLVHERNIQEGAAARVEQRKQHDRRPLQNTTRPIVALPADMQLLAQVQRPRRPKPANINLPAVEPELTKTDAPPDIAVATNRRRGQHDHAMQPVNKGENNTVTIQGADMPHHMTGARNIAPELPFQQEQQQAEEADGCIML